MIENKQTTQAPSKDHKRRWQKYKNMHNAPSNMSTHRHGAKPKIRVDLPCATKPRAPYPHASLSHNVQTRIKKKVSKLKK